MKTFNVPLFYNGFCCYFNSTCFSFDKIIKLFTLSWLHPLHCRNQPTIRNDNLKLTENIKGTKHPIYGNAWDSHLIIHLKVGHNIITRYSHFIHTYNSHFSTLKIDYLKAFFTFYVFHLFFSFHFIYLTFFSFNTLFSCLACSTLKTNAPSTLHHIKPYTLASKLTLYFCYTFT